MPGPAVLLPCNSFTVFLFVIQKALFFWVIFQIVIGFFKQRILHSHTYIWSCKYVTPASSQEIIYDKAVFCKQHLETISQSIRVDKKENYENRSNISCDILIAKRGRSSHSLFCHTWLSDSSTEVSRPALCPWPGRKAGQAPANEDLLPQHTTCWVEPSSWATESPCGLPLFSGIWAVWCGSRSFQPHRAFRMQLAEQHCVDTPGRQSPAEGFNKNPADLLGGQGFKSSLFFANTAFLCD